MGRLLEKLGLKRTEADSAPDEKDMAAVDLAQLCPPTAPAENRPDRAKLGRKAREMMEGSSNSFIGARNPLPAPLLPDSTARPLANPTAPVVGDLAR
jgi:hypothetical protein